ncbi:MAG: class I SAM-dependent methyltransferase [Chloroflexi bacterium]|nr:class I SAM-dependent methyltransferase [Chloroflexota bacterium]
MGMYEDYAAVYDAAGQLQFSQRMVPYLQRLLGRHPAPGTTLAEVACGTGTVAVAMARAGWRVYGVDGAPAMLEQARAKARAEGVQIDWSVQDMRSFALPQPVHLVTCLYDSINYMLTSDDLSAAIQRAYSALTPQGLYLFDMNTAAVMATWADGTYFTDTETLTWIMSTDYDPRRQRTTVRVTCFERLDAGGLYRKIAEEHAEQAYPEEHVATLLVDAGFAIEGHYSCFTLSKSTPATFRIMWVARHP